MDELSEAEMEPLLELLAARRNRRSVDDWGDLNAQMDASMRASLRALDAQERNAGLEPWQP